MSSISQFKKLGCTLVALVLVFQTYLLASAGLGVGLTIGWVAVGCLSLGIVLALGWAPSDEAEEARADRYQTPSQAATPIAAAPVEPPASALDLLSILQSKGRLIDFLMDDVSKYSDTQVAAAARVVHRGCAAVIHDHLSLKPLVGENEGAEIEVPTGYSPQQYRIVGKTVGVAPYRGRVIHRGWALERADLPHRSAESAFDFPIVTPAEVEIH